MSQPTMSTFFGSRFLGEAQQHFRGAGIQFADRPCPDSALALLERLLG
jgi:hypothetical protein